MNSHQLRVALAASLTALVLSGLGNVAVYFAAKDARQNLCTKIEAIKVPLYNDAIASEFELAQPDIREQFTSEQIARAKARAAARKLVYEADDC